MMRALVVALLAVAALAGCERERRTLQPAPSPTPGPLPAAAARAANPHEENAQSLADGKRMFKAFNCSGCHANGGGDKGPALMDDEWIYGSAPSDVYTSIVAGRPNGMPAFGERIGADDAWKLAAYVRSLSGLVPKAAATSRDDAIESKPAENRVVPPERVVVTGKAP